MPSSGPGPEAPTWDVVVVGAGPAGAATALTLAGLGRRVLLVERGTTARFKLGESLPPVSIDLVRHFLGDIEDPGWSPGGHYRTAGNLSLWSAGPPDVTDFYFTPTGFGLCVDRLAFDEALRKAAVAAGATLRTGCRLEACERIAERSANWRLTLASDPGASRHLARYVVDCSGRRAVLATALGVPTVAHDRLFAYAQWFSREGADDDRHTRVEAASGGWWYSNRLPGAEGGETRRLMVFHTDRDLPEAKSAGHPEGFERLLDASTLMAPLLRDGGYRPCGAIRGAPAGSQRLREFCGEAWMAVGDAAQAYDPLSSQGIDKALRTGSHAGHMIHYALAECEESRAPLDGRNAYVRQYAEQQGQLWQTYLSRLGHYYGIQTRWSDRPFWQRRSLAAGEVAASGAS